MKAGTYVLTALLALICADDAAAHRGGSFAHSGVGVSAPRAFVGRPAFVARPAFVSRSFATRPFVGRPFVGRPFVHAPFPRTRIIAAPVLFFPPPPIYYAPPPVYYVPPVTYADPNYYAPPSYPSGSYYDAPPAASDPQYQPPPTGSAQPQPPVAQAPRGPDYLYFCPDTRQYYPAAAECASGWLKVVPDTGTIR